MVKKNSSKNPCCFSEKTNCCTPTGKKEINIDFLYLDLNVCTPCQGTEESLDEALNDVSKVLIATNIQVNVNKINVTTEKQAINLKFESSPTIRINGRDIQLEVRESSCETCSDLSGVETNCRIWVYQAQEYNTPPKAMIIESILKEVYGGGNHSVVKQEGVFTLPENLKSFFKAINAKKSMENNTDI